MDYIITIVLTEEENTAMKAIAVEAEKTVQGILDTLGEEMIKGQINQWIKERATNRIKEVGYASVITKLAEIDT